MLCSVHCVWMGGRCRWRHGLVGAFLTTRSHACTASHAHTQTLAPVAAWCPQPATMTMGHHSYDSPFSSLDVCMFHFSLSLTLSFFSFSHSPHSVASSIYIFFLSFPFYPQYLGNFPSSCLCSCETVKKRRKKLCTILSSSNKTAAAAALLRIAKDDDDSLHTRVLLLFLW